jgi:hypothetical protein
MKRIIVEIIASLLVLLFLYTSVSKFLEFQTFIGEMNNQPFPNWMTPYLVWTLPSLEILLSLGLIFERTRMAALYGSLGLMTLFTIYTALVLFRFFPYVPCSCGGVIKNLTWPQHLFFNLFFVTISFVGIKLKRRIQKDSSKINSPILANN